MLNKRIEYYSNVPINAYVSYIHEQPVHSHNNDLEIIIALKGTIKVIVGYRTLLLKEGEMFIFNDRDIHGVYETNGENLVLTVHISIKHFKKYNKAAFSSFFLMADTYLKENRYDKPVEELKDYLFRIAKLQILQNESNDTMEALGKELFQKLIMEFQYFYYSTSGGSHFVNRYEGKDNQAQAARVRGVMYYLWENYNQKVTLQEYADETHINMYYLSHIIKNSTGLNFQELLNFTRVEASESLLLETNKKISEIAFDCGFSATRYYVKNFEKWFQMGPNEYRARHMNRVSRKIREDVLDAEAAVKVIEEFLGHMRCIAAGKPYFYTEVIEIDVGKKARKRRNPYHQLIEWDYSMQSKYGIDQEELKNISKPFRLCARVSTTKDFNRCLLTFLQESKSHSLLFVYDTTRKTKAEYNKIFESLGEFCYRCNIESIVVNIEYIGGISDKMRASIAENIIETGRKVKCKITVREVPQCSTGRYMGNYLFDSIYIVPWIIRSSFKAEHEQKFINTVFDNRQGHGNVINGGAGIITGNYIKKPSYYAYMCLSMLGDEIIDNTESYIVTKNNQDIKILLYDYDVSIFNNIDEYTDLNKLAMLSYIKERNKEYKLELFNLNGKYVVSEISLGKDICLFNKMIKMEMSDVLISEEEKLMRDFLRPQFDFSVIDVKNGAASMDVKVPQYGALLLQLHKII